MARFERRRGFGFKRELNKPIKVGEEYDVEITETGSKGDGIARIKNFVVFVNGSKKGEKTRIKITQVRNRFAVGQKIKNNETEFSDSRDVEGVEEITEEVVKEAEKD